MEISSKTTFLMTHAGDETVLLMDQLLQGDRWVFALKIDASAIGSAGRRT
jgi:hypothetical protein